MQETKLFWDTTKQEPIVEEALKHLKMGNALDLGAGEGRDALFLARQGFDVTVVGSEQKSLKTLRARNSELESKLHIHGGSILDYTPTQKFDLVVCDMVLHFLKPQEVEKMIGRMQAWTVAGGLNVITAYTTRNAPGKRPYLFKPNELASFYSGWDIVKYDERPTLWFHLAGESDPRRNHAAYLIARRHS